MPGAAQRKHSPKKPSPKKAKLGTQNALTVTCSPVQSLSESATTEANANLLDVLVLDWIPQLPLPKPMLSAWAGSELAKQAKEERSTYIKFIWTVTRYTHKHIHREQQRLIWRSASSTMTTILTTSKFATGEICSVSLPFQQGNQRESYSHTATHTHTHALRFS